MKPEARQDLVVRELDDELVVYDFASHKAHCVNRAALEVWRRCDGRSSAREIARALSLDEDVVWLALDQLDRAQLLTAPLDRRDKIDRRRRMLLKKMALTAGLSVTLPAVWSILAPTPAYAASVMCIPGNQCIKGVNEGECCGTSGTPAMCCHKGMCNKNGCLNCMGNICSDQDGELPRSW